MDARSETPKIHYYPWSQYGAFTMWVQTTATSKVADIQPFGKYAPIVQAQTGGK